MNIVESASILHGTNKSERVAIWNLRSEHWWANNTNTIKQVSEGEGMVVASEADA